MRKTAAITVFTLALPLAAGAVLGDVLASWETPRPGSGFNGIVYDGENMWVKHTNSYEGYVFKCTTVGSVVTEIPFPYPAPSFYSFGLTFDGEYLWTIYHYWRMTSFDDFRKYTTTGSYAGGFGLHFWYPPYCKAVTWDGKNLYTGESPPVPYRIGKYTTAGTLVATFPLAVGGGSDWAYYKRQLWSYGRGGLVYGVTLNGSVVASFAAPGGSCEGTAFDGEYLWTIDENNPQYVYKVDIDVVGEAPASLGRVKALYR